MTSRKYANRSLGGLRTNPYRGDNPYAPETLGRILLNRDLIIELHAGLVKTGADEVEATLAGWNNANKLPNGKIDRFQTIEVRAMGKGEKPWLQPQKPQVRSLEEFFAGDD